MPGTWKHNNVLGADFALQHQPPIAMMILYFVLCFILGISEERSYDIYPINTSRNITANTHCVRCDDKAILIGHTHVFALVGADIIPAPMCPEDSQRCRDVRTYL